jgi:hypothetical protein
MTFVCSIDFELPSYIPTLIEAGLVNLAAAAQYYYNKIFGSKLWILATHHFDEQFNTIIKNMEIIIRLDEYKMHNNNIHPLSRLT